MRHKLFQIGIAGVIFIYFIFCVIYSGQDWMKQMYYFVMPLSFLLMTLGYNHQNSFIRIGRNTLIATVGYNFLKLFGFIEYNFEGTKVLVPSVIFLSIIYQIIVDYKNGNFNTK